MAKKITEEDIKLIIKEETLKTIGQLPPPEGGGLHPNKAQRGQVPILVR